MRADAVPKVKSSSTIRAALSAARAMLDSADMPDLDAQVLLAHSLDIDRAFLFAHPERILSDWECAAFLNAIRRRAAGEPIAYITGAKGFYDINLQVKPAVLIPRPETELLLEEALRLSGERPDLNVADIGTGSGALAVAIALHQPEATVYATEISRDALAIARGNAERNGVDPTFLEGDLAEPLIQRRIKIDLLMANLPYIATDELASLEVSRFEPRLALDGGIDGLALIRRLLRQIPAVCRDGAYVLLEIGADQGESVARLVEERLGSRCDIVPDYAGLDRIARFRVRVNRNAESRRLPHPRWYHLLQSWRIWRLSEGGLRAIPSLAARARAPASRLSPAAASGIDGRAPVPASPKLSR